MNGLIVINKDENYTSRDVVNFLNHFFGTKKIGHTGTLDPIATGVLVCLMGKYTKLVDEVTAYDKEYIAEVKLGIETDTLDITGNILKEQKVNISLEKVKKVFEEFPHQYFQTVPKYSAVKIKGKKLYEYARSNIDVSLPEREVNIYSLELIEFKNNIIKFKTKVSKGTYIRSLIKDICHELKVIGTMQSLVRTKQGNFSIDKAYSIEEIKNNHYQILNIKEFLDYPVKEIDANLLKIISNGGQIKNTWKIKDKVIFTYQGNDLAIYYNDHNILKCYLNLN